MGTFTLRHGASFSISWSEAKTCPCSSSASSSASKACSTKLLGRSAVSLTLGAETTARRRDVCSDGYGYEGVSLLTSKLFGASVPVPRVFSKPTTRPHASSSRIPAHASPRSALVQKVNANELDSILSAERTSPMIIDFYATWCGPCVVLAQELEQLAVEYGGDIRFLKVDTDEEHELASQMEIRGLPTMVFVSKDVDKLAIRTEGLLPTNAIRDIIEKEILV